MAERGTQADPGRRAQAGDPLAPGTRVEVRKRFDATWARGFEVIGATERGYRIKRLSDGSELPTPFSGDDVRVDRRTKRGVWWY